MPYLSYFIIDIFVIIALVVLTFIVLLRDRRAQLNRLLAAFTMSICVWMLANYVSNDINLKPRIAVVANYFVFFFSYAATIALLRFAITLAQDGKAKKVFQVFFPGLLLIDFMAATPLVVKGVTRQGSVYAVNFGPGISAYGVCLISMILATVVVIYVNLRQSSDGQRARLRVLLATLCWALPGTVIMEFILPTTTGWFGLTNLGMLPMLILVFGLYYGAVKHQLFDLRFYVVRAAAYTLSLLVLGLVYVAPLMYVVTIVIMGYTYSWPKFVVGVLIATLAALNYERVRHNFDSLTSRIFFREDYDATALLSDINNVLVSTVDLEKLLLDSANLLSRDLKSDYCLFALYGHNNPGVRLIGNAPSRLSKSDITKIHHAITLMTSKTIIADYLDEDERVIKEVLNRNRVAAIVRLTSNNERHASDLGYVMMGLKRSGNTFNKKDIRTMETIANVMVIGIQNALHYEEIQTFNLTLQQQVEQRTRQLQRTNAKLVALDETKDDFISMASHQLRTPLTAVKGYISMVLDGDAGQITPLQKKMLNQAFMSSQRMVFLIADLLNVSRLKTGKFVIEPVPVNLANMIGEEIGQLREEAATRSLQLAYDKPKQFPTLMLDETKIRQVVMNFIDNAIHYTPQGGHIRVTLTNLPQAIELKVSDDGIGVPKSEQHHLFTKFYRAANARRERPDGTGLGLFMAKKVIVAQGGAVLFESREGKGSTFGFTLPKATLAAAE